MNPLVSVIIPHHLNQNQNYLDICLESLSRQPGIESGHIEVIVTSSAPCKPKVPEFATLHWPIESKHYAEKINKSIALTNPNSKYILLGSDDLIFSYGSVMKLCEMAGDYAVILNAMSNCDNHYFFEGDISVKGKTLDRFMTIDQLSKEQIESIMQTPFIGPKVMFPQRYVCFYCTLIPRNVYNLVGPLDENYLTGYEDADYCEMAKQKQIGCAITPHTMIFHWGGRTSSKTVTEADKAHNPAYFRNKHGHDHIP